MKIPVYQEDIDKGVPGEFCECAIALAFQRLLGKRCYVGQSVRVSASDGSFIGLPETAIDFIQRFDNGEDVAPFEFELRDVDYEKLVIQAKYVAA